MENLILVTGTSGFVGSKIVSKLFDENYKVVALIHLKRALIPNSKLIEKSSSDIRFSISTCSAEKDIQFNPRQMIDILDRFIKENI